MRWLLKVSAVDTAEAITVSGAKWAGSGDPESPTQPSGTSTVRNVYRWVRTSGYDAASSMPAPCTTIGAALRRAFLSIRRNCDGHGLMTSPPS